MLKDFTRCPLCNRKAIACDEWDSSAADRVESARPTGDLPWRGKSTSTKQERIDYQCLNCETKFVVHRLIEKIITDDLYVVSETE